MAFEIPIPLDLLVELTSGSGRVMHKYSVLLDLPKVSR